MTNLELLERRFAGVAAGLFALVLAAFAAPAQAAEPAPVVVELFTSQACNSCPPADAFLRELARRPGVLALSMHVDYWNALGWRDTWSSPEVTDRQRAYARALGTRYVSTPQAIIDGRASAVGSDREAIDRLIDEARARKGAGVTPKLTVDARGRLWVRLPDNRGVGDARVWLIAFDDRHEIAIPSGENAGRTISYVHVVRALRPIGTWSGRAKTLSADITADRAAGRQNCAVLVQAAGHGPIIGAASLAVKGH